MSKNGKSFNEQLTKAAEKYGLNTVEKGEEQKPEKQKVHDPNTNFTNIADLVVGKTVKLLNNVPLFEQVSVSENRDALYSVKIVVLANDAIGFANRMYTGPYLFGLPSVNAGVHFAADCPDNLFIPAGKFIQFVKVLPKGAIKFNIWDELITIDTENIVTCENVV